jgi:hypothetical protein
LTLAGAGAVVGAVILAATKQKGIQGLIKSATTGTQTSQATAVKFIKTAAPATGPSLLQRLLGGKL